MKNIKPLIVAEMSGNHNQSLARALKLVDAAAEAGADAVKLQTFKPETMTLNLNKGEFVLKQKGVEGRWKNKTLFNIFKEAQTPWEWHKAIINRAKKKKIKCFSTPFDETAVDFLEKFNMPFYKIASAENTHYPLIRKVAKTGKPLIISTGMINIDELDDTISLAKKSGCKDLTILKCTTSYPASPKESNILTIPYLRKRYNCKVGISDHTMGIGVAIAAVAQGACMVEKHITLNRKDGGIDSFFSMEPNEMKTLVRECKIAYESLGAIQKRPVRSETKYLNYRRSIYVVKNISKGEKFTTKNIKIIRPGLGLHPKYFKKILNRKAKKNLKRGTATNWKVVTRS